MGNVLSLCWSLTDLAIQMSSSWVKLFAFTMLFYFPFASAQIKSGTVIAIFFSEDKVVLAGDSRVVLMQEGVSGQHRDDECKIFALKNNVIYAASGMIAHDFLPGEIGAAWNAHREAVQIASRTT